jgi:hypothetical protein
MVLYLQNSTGWRDDSPQTATVRTLGVWNYRNRAGHNYGEYTYTRRFASDLWDVGAIDRVNHTIRLNKPLPELFRNPDHPDGTWPAGTAVSNMAGGGTYQYCAASMVPTPATWTRYSGVIRGVTHTGKGENCMFPPGTAYTTPLLLLGYTKTIPGTQVKEPLVPNPVLLDLAHLRWVRLE